MAPGCASTLHRFPSSTITTSSPQAPLLRGERAVSTPRYTQRRRRQSRSTLEPQGRLTLGQQRAPFPLSLPAPPPPAFCSPSQKSGLSRSLQREVCGSSQSAQCPRGPSGCCRQQVSLAQLSSGRWTRITLTHSSADALKQLAQAGYVNSAARSVSAGVASRTCFHFLWTGQTAALHFTVFKTLHTLLHSGCTDLHPHQQYQSVPFSSHPRQSYP